MGFPRNLGDLDLSAAKPPVVAGTEQTRPAVVALTAAGSERAVQRGTPKRRTTKRGGTEAEESERSIRPAKRGNRTGRDPAEERGRRSRDPLKGKTTRDAKLD
jgi:hypothetical protein